MPFVNFTCKSENDYSSHLADILSIPVDDRQGNRSPSSTPNKGTDSNSPLQTFQLNYKNLSDRLRCCLDYVSIYGKHAYPMEKRKLVWLLLAYGRIQTKTGEIMEDTAEKIIEELAGLGMLLDIDDGNCVKLSRRYWGFSVFNVERDTFDRTACENSPIHLIVYGGNKDVPTDLHGIFLQSLFFRATEKLSGASLGTMFGGLNFLLVLDLDKIEYLPSEVGDLVHLRYLGVEDSSISELPSSIGNLKNLQTLDIRQCDIEKLPDEILSMEKLRHIEMSSSIGDCEIRVPSGIGTLVHLHSLCGVYAGDVIAQELSSLTQLRELGVKRVSDDHAGELLESIMKMDDLVSLSLEAETNWIDGEAEDSMKTTLLPSLEGFSPPPLRKLYLHGRVVELPEWIALTGKTSPD